MKLNYKRTIYVGFAFFLICAFWQAYDTIVPKILTDKFGMSQSLSGVIMALDNVLALFLLPFFGALSDRTSTRFGRRTPYIIVGTILAAMLTIMLSFADNMQLELLSDVDISNPTAQTTLYEADLTISTPAGETLVLIETFTQAEFEAIAMYGEDGTATADYTNYVVPARQAYANMVTANDSTALIFFVVVLLFLLLSMSIFRSPAVALMPDVTIKPLRSKGNAVINLLGAVGGIIILILGTVLGTGKIENALMSYSTFFMFLAGLMVVSLVIFLTKVREVDFVEEMKETSINLGLEIADDDESLESGDRTLSKSEKRSLILILASVVLWYFGYNAITTKYSVYASSILNLDYNTTLTIATASAILTYIPVGFIATKFGRKKTILAGVFILASAFLAASFMRAGSSLLTMNLLFCAAGIGWATINVNSYPMVVELASGSDTGKYTGYYYTASMAAQTATPIISGFFMDNFGFTTLFPYASVCVALAFVTMMFVMHGDSVTA